MLGVPISGRPQMCRSIWQHLYPILWLCYLSWSHPSTRSEGHHVQEDPPEGQWRVEVHPFLCQTGRARHWWRRAVLPSASRDLQHPCGKLHLQQQGWLQYCQYSTNNKSLAPFSLFSDWDVLLPTILSIPNYCMSYQCLVLFVIMGSLFVNLQIISSNIVTTVQHPSKCNEFFFILNVLNSAYLKTKTSNKQVYLFLRKEKSNSSLFRNAN